MNSILFQDDLKIAFAYHLYKSILRPLLYKGRRDWVKVAQCEHDQDGLSFGRAICSRRWIEQGTNVTLPQFAQGKVCRLSASFPARCEVEGRVQSHWFVMSINRIVVLPRSMTKPTLQEKHTSLASLYLISSSNTSALWWRQIRSNFVEHKVKS